MPLPPQLLAARLNMAGQAWGRRVRHSRSVGPDSHGRRAGRADRRVGFETLTADFVQGGFARFNQLRPGNFCIEKGGGIA